MDNKTKVKVAVVIGIVVLAVIFIFMVIFVKSNRTPVNKDIPRKTQSNVEKNTVVDSNSDEEENGEPKEEISNLDDVVGIGIKDDNLVKINSDLSSTIVKKLGNDYSEFCYGDSKVYIAFNNEDEGCSILEIDLLNNNLEKTIFTSKEFNSINELSYYAGKLYFVSQKGQLIEYSISEEYAKSLTNENEVSYFVIDESKNCMYVSYKTNGQNAGIYILDFTANNFTQIITLNDLSGKLLLNGNSLIIDVKEFGKLYVYNVESNTITEMGDNNNSKNLINQVVFYGNVLLYTNGTTIDIKDSNGNSYQDGWYSLNENEILGIYMLDSSKLQVSTSDKNIIINLTDGTMIEMQEKAYSDVVIIK